MSTNFDFRRNAIPTQEDKSRLREELEQQMAEYKGEITVLPSVSFRGSAKHKIGLSEELYNNKSMTINRKLRLWLDQNPTRKQELAKLTEISVSCLVNKANGHQIISSFERDKIKSALDKLNGQYDGLREKIAIALRKMTYKQASAIIDISETTFYRITANDDRVSNKTLRGLARQMEIEA